MASGSGEQRVAAALAAVEGQPDLEGLVGALKDHLHEPEHCQEVARDCIALFVQCNFTGPPLAHDHAVVLADDLHRTQVLEALERDGEGMVAVVRCPLLLVLADTALLQVPQEGRGDSWRQLRLRCARVHQQSLDSPSASLQKLLLGLVDELTTEKGDNNNEGPAQAREERAGVLLECACTLVLHHRFGSARSLVERACALLGFHMELTGVMTKRMKYQQEDKASLVVAVAREGEGEGKEGEGKEGEGEEKEGGGKEGSVRFERVMANDEDLLNTPEIKGQVKGESLRLRGIEVCCCVLQGVLLARSEVGELREQEAAAFLERAERDAVDFLPHLVALLNLSIFRFGRTRTREASMLQVEGLVGAMDAHAATVQQRSLFFGVLPTLPWWDMHKQLAKMQRALGMVKTALDVYTRLEDWEQMIECCVSLGRLSQVEAMVQERLAVRREAKLLVILGDIHKDENLYVEAWEVSKHRHANAQRRLGRNALRRGDTHAGIKHFELALSVNSLHPDTWFRLATAATEVKDHAKAANAYTQCVAQDPTNGQAWNNLAAAFLDMGKLVEAHTSFKQALKHLRESKRIWDNFLVVSLKLREFSDVLVATETIFGLSEGYEVDTDALTVLVDVVEMRQAEREKDKDKADEGKSGAKEGEGEGEGEGHVERVVAGEGEKEGNASPEQEGAQQQGDWYSRRVLELFGKVTARTAANPKVWSLYARLKGILGDTALAVEYQTRCCRHVDQPGWESDPEAIKGVARAYATLAEYAIAHNDKRTLFSVRSALMSAAKRASGCFEGGEEHTLLLKWVEEVKEAEQALKAAQAS